MSAFQNNLVKYITYSNKTQLGTILTEQSVRKFAYAAFDHLLINRAKVKFNNCMYCGIVDISQDGLLAD